MYCQANKLIRVIVGLLFLFSAVLKLLSPGRITTSLVVSGSPATLVPIIIAVVVLLEFGVGIGLIFLAEAAGTARTAIVILLVFAGYLAWISHLESPPECGCFGPLRLFKESRTNALFGIGRNLLLIVSLYANCLRKARSQ